MRSLILVASFLLGIAVQSANASMDVCVQNSLFTSDLQNTLNRDYVPGLGAQLVAAIGALGGRDPQASVSPVIISVIPQADGTQKLQIYVTEFKYNIRIGDNDLFAGARVGVRGPMSIRARPTLDLNKKAVILTDVDISLQMRVDMGGTLGHWIGDLLTGLLNAFALNGRAANLILDQFSKTSPMPSFFQTSIGKDSNTTPITLKLESIRLGSQDFCMSADID